MSILPFKMTKEAHMQAKTIVYTELNQKIPYILDKKEMKIALEKARKYLRECKSYNTTVKNNLNIEFKYNYIGLKTSEYDEKWYGDTWEIIGSGDFKIIFRKGVGNRYYFWDSRGTNAVTAFILPPSSMDILYCLMSDDPHNMSFDGWCCEYGYDTDSRKAEKIYQECIKQTMMFKRNYPRIDLDFYKPLQNF